MTTNPEMEAFPEFPVTVNGHVLTEEIVKQVLMCFITQELNGTREDVAKRCASELGLDVDVALAAVEFCENVGFVEGHDCTADDALRLRHSARLLLELADRVGELPDEFVEVVADAIHGVHYRLFNAR